MRLHIDVSDVIVRTEAERHQIERVGAAVQEAFRLLATQLERTPAGRLGDLHDRVVAALDTDVLTLDDLLSPRGAERLADEWYRQLVEDERG